MAQLVDAIREWAKRNTRPPARTWPALLGDAAGVVDVPGLANHVYVRMPDGSTARAYNDRVPVLYDLPVIVGFDDWNTNLFQVLSQRAAYGDGAAPAFGASVGPHATTHRYRGSDPIWVDPEQFLPGLPRAQNPPDWTIILPEVYYPRGSGLARFEQVSSASFESDVPTVGGKAVWVCVSLSPSGTVTYTLGSEFDYPFVTDPPQYMATVPSGHFVIADVLLRWDTTSIQQDAIDARRRGYFSFAQIPPYQAGLILGTDGTQLVWVEDQSGGEGGGGSGGDLPIGSVIAYAGVTAPEGWLVCDGSAVSRTTYSELFVILGTTFGSGDGSTTFNLPDLRGRSVVGAGSGSGLTPRSLGQTGGEETHTLNTGEMPAHSHGANTAESLFEGAYNRLIWMDGTSPATRSSVVDSAGGGGAHNTMHPFAVLTYLIKFQSTSSSGGSGDTAGSERGTTRLRYEAGESVFYLTDYATAIDTVTLNGFTLDPVQYTYDPLTATITLDEATVIDGIFIANYALAFE